MSNQPYQPQPKNSTLAILSLVSGIAGWTLVPFFGALLAIVTGHMARREIIESEGEISGQGLAKAGLGLGYGCLGTILLLVVIAIGIISFGVEILNPFGTP